jgi:hypothetical protein
MNQFVKFLWIITALDIAYIFVALLMCRIGYSLTESTLILLISIKIFSTIYTHMKSKETSHEN